LSWFIVSAGGKSPNPDFGPVLTAKPFEPQRAPRKSKTKSGFTALSKHLCLSSFLVPFVVQIVILFGFCFGF
jgi:hypothetical protein